LRNGRITFMIVALVLAAVVGGVLGDIVGTFLPQGAVKILFEESYRIGLETFTVQLYAVSFTLGLMFEINFVSILMIILVIAYFKWWYL